MDRWEEKENRRFLRAGTIAAAALNATAIVDQFLGAKRHDFFTANSFFKLPQPPQPKKNLVAAAEKFFGVVNLRNKRRERAKRSA
jgi:hypothetical protein